MITFMDFHEMTEAQIKAWLSDAFEEPSEKFDNIKILVALKEEDISSGDVWVVYTDPDGLWLVRGTRCSCYGFEDQWTPEKITPAWVASPMFSFSHFWKEQARHHILKEINA